MTRRPSPVLALLRRQVARGPAVSATHTCEYNEPCDACDDQLARDVEWQVRRQRGRWMVVDEHGFAYRFDRKSQARSMVAHYARAEMRARLLRFTRDRCRFDPELFGWVAHARWIP